MLRSSHATGIFLVAIANVLLFVHSEGIPHAHYNDTFRHTTALKVNEVSSAYKSLIDESDGTSVLCSLTTGIYSPLMNSTDSGILKNDVLCITDSQKVLKLEGDMSRLPMESGNPLNIGRAKLRIPLSAITDIFSVNLDDLKDIVMILLDKREEAMKDPKFFGTRRVLVVLLSDMYGNAPSQSLEVMHDDVFGDTNTLVSSISLSDTT